MRSLRAELLAYLCDPGLHTVLISPQMLSVGGGIRCFALASDPGYRLEPSAGMPFPDKLRLSCHLGQKPEVELQVDHKMSRF